MPCRRQDHLANKRPGYARSYLQLAWLKGGFPWVIQPKTHTSCQHPFLLHLHPPTQSYASVSGKAWRKSNAVSVVSMSCRLSRDCLATVQAR